MSAVSSPKHIDFFLAILFPLFAAALTVLVNAPFIISILLFFFFPALYFMARSPSSVPKILLMMLCTIPFTVVVDYFAMRDGAWYDSSIFSWRIMNGIPIEDFLWTATWFAYILSVYEFFIDRPHSKNDTHISRRWKSLVGSWFLALFLFLPLYFVFGERLHIPYFYLIFTTVLGMVPLVSVIYLRPRILLKLVALGVYFFFVSIIHELSALHTGQWIFPGSNVVGWVVLGPFRFPIEEFISFMMLGSLYVVSYYELFVDDRR